MDEPIAGRCRLFGLLASPPLAWLTIFFLAPLAIIWTYSFGHNIDLIHIRVDGSLANYAHALKPLYLAILGKSLVFAALTTGLCLVIGFPIAVAIAFASPRAKAWLMLLIMLPFWTNLLVRTYALMAVLRSGGYVNHVLGLGWSGVASLAAAVGLGMPPFRPLSLLHNDFAVVVGLVYVQLPFMVLPLYAALDRLDRSLIEAALDLGAGQLESFARVVAPMAGAGILSGALVTFIPALGAYLTPDLLGGPSSMMIANVIERQFKSADDWPFGAALSFLLMYMTFIAIAGRAVLARRRREERA